MAKKKKQNKKEEFNFRVNEKINQWGKVNEVRIVGEDYNDVYNFQDALNMAYNQDLDLVEINPNSNPPICKIIDYQKFLFEKKKKQKETEKNNRKNRQDLKELRFGPNTDEHDFTFKKNHAIKFLENGDKIKAYVFFKGREMQFKEKGEILLLRRADDLEDLCKVDMLPKMEGNRMIMNLSPKK
jgi:translation initiation factor IF-3